MTDKAYIVANKQQELDVLHKFEEKGFRWNAGDNPTSFVPSERFNFKENNFPYMLMITNDRVWWSVMKELENQTIVYDGRKEENMYKVTQEFMNELIKWRDYEDIDVTSGKNYNYVNDNDLDELPAVAEGWWVYDNDPIERNNRLIAIIQWLNGEDVFEVEEPHKFVVRSEHADRDGDYIYVGVDYDIFTTYRCDLNCATKFNTREEAQEWANSHQLVVEIDAEGNEVE